ncbi:response regulator [Pseudomonas chlororaphis]|uniref:response regulator n=1 Tax=Pseudomonas chlororaphis TaxID=587753 RepID=UPI0007B3A72E|nr:response regulator [Pseudomonas chlororaphis]AZC64536.1 DNA-binding response regulator, LuxR family [Pseudomonas chlororaphis subsp. piscium]AZC96841.1 DNA-binding response regulator, LuxR family [Pseudomonas chlororaphis subsp. piscium]KZO48410.1 PAS domain S-box [Pseudomonas chlororaphis subsp. piscium]MBP5070332.1 response regulator [Pseudomonas chlororaphis]QTT88043.1 response regulator [Pseudomonas chlororaphis]
MGRIMIVDSHPIIRYAIRSRLEEQGHEIVAESGSGLDTLTTHRELRPDLVILELNTRKLGGLDLIRRMRAHNDSLKILVFSSENAEYFAGRCLQAGTFGFVSKDDDLEELDRGVKAALSGRSYFPVGAGGLLATRSSENEALHQLSERELTVLQYLAQGLSNQGVANLLSISFKTVSTYKTRLMQKLNVTSLIEVIEIYNRNSFNHGESSTRKLRPALHETLNIENELYISHSIVTSMLLQIHACDAQGRLIFCNQAFCDFIGKSQAEVYGKQIADLGWPPFDEVENFKAEYFLMVQKSRPNSGDLVLHIDRQPMIIQYWTTPAHDRNGDLLGMICGALNMTDRGKI